MLSVHPGPIATDMAIDAGFEEIADPPSLVGDGIVAALAAGDFHLFPDSMANLTELKTLKIKDNPLAPGELERLKTMLPGCKIKG